MSQPNEKSSVELVGERAGDAGLASFASPSGPIPQLNLCEPEVKAEPKICEFCGFYITEYKQRCAALDDGVCRP